jgi:hypothetical protein
VKLKIEVLNIKTVQTRSGERERYSILCDGNWYSSFAGSWNRDWSKGKEIEVADEQIITKKVGDRVYSNILPPKGYRAGREERILRGVEAIWKDIQLIKRKLQIYEPKGRQNHGN